MTSMRWTGFDRAEPLRGFVSGQVISNFAEIHCETPACRSGPACTLHRTDQFRVCIVSNPVGDFTRSVFAPQRSSHLTAVSGGSSEVPGIHA